MAVVRRWLTGSTEWFNSGRAPQALTGLAKQYVSGDVIYVEDPVWPDAGTFHGRDAVIGRFLEYEDLMQIQTIEPGEVVDVGELILFEVRIEMLGGEGTARPIDFLWTYTAQIKDGLLTHIRAWFDGDEARRAAGVGE